MATYKNGHKKKGNDKFFSYVLIGFAITFFVILLSLVIFNALDDTVVIDVPTLTEMEEDQYLVYFYSDSCPACVEIKDEVASFAASNNAGIKLYYLDAATLAEGEYDYLYNTYGINGTPAMLTIVDGYVVHVVPGYIDIPITFDQINNGTYSFIN